MVVLNQQPAPRRARRDDLIALPSKRGQDVVAQGEAVVAERRSTPAALVLEIAQPLFGRVGEGDCRLRSSSDQAPAARVGQDRVQHLLGAPLGQIPLRWTPPTAPRLADHTLMLTCGIAPFDHPTVARLALLAKDVAADRRRAEFLHGPDARGGMGRREVSRKGPRLGGNSLIEHALNPTIFGLPEPDSGPRDAIIIRASASESLLRHFVKAPQQRGFGFPEPFLASIRRITRPPDPALAGGERQRGATSVPPPAVLSTLSRPPSAVTLSVIPSSP